MKAMPYQPKIILTTAYTEANIAEYGDQVLGYLIKPFTFDSFVKAVEKALPVQ
jgi:two-component SAPR family response regulator